MRRNPSLPSRSTSTLRGRPPSDASKADSEAFTDAINQVQTTGSIDKAARKLALYAKMTGGAAPAPAAPPPQAAASPAAGPSNAMRGKYNMADEDEFAVAEDDDDDEDVVMSGQTQGGQGGAEEEQEVVHLQEIVEGLWVGDLVAAMDTEGLEEKGISNILSLLRPKIRFIPHFSVFPLEIDDSADTDILTHLPTCVAWIGEALRRNQRSKAVYRRSSTSSQHRRRSSSHSPTSPLSKSDRDNSPEAERDVLIRHLPQTKPGGVLIHCQAGMSRSATVAAAYLMTALSLTPEEAVSMIREKRPVVDPSDTFWHQLGLFYNADGKVTLRDRGTRQFYMERTTTSFMNRGATPDVTKMAKYPATPTASSPPTPIGSHGRRKIRCRTCRRHLAVREHMMDHILDQSPVSRPRTPSVGGGHSRPGTPGMTSIHPLSPTNEKDAGAGSLTMERRPSVVSDIINPLTGLPGARSRVGSMSASSERPILDGRGRSGSTSIPGQDNGANGEIATGMSSASVPIPRSGSFSSGGTFGLTSIDPTRSKSLSGASRIGAPQQQQQQDQPIVDTPGTMSRSNSLDSSKAASTGPVSRRPSGQQQGQPHQRTFQSAEQLYSHLPPQLAALRMVSQGVATTSAAPASHSNGNGSAPSSGNNININTNVNSGMVVSPDEKPQSGSPTSTSQNQNQNQFAHSHHAHLHGEGAKTAARRMSMLALTPSDPHGSGFGSGGASAGVGAGVGNGGGESSSSPRERRGSGYGFGFGGEIALSGPPILANPKCSGYFVEPLTWMEPVLASGQISGKLVCPNEKCGAKIGNYDWAGVQCGCKEWVTPGFCISRSKVDEVW